MLAERTQRFDERLIRQFRADEIDRTPEEGLEACVARAPGELGREPRLADARFVPPQIRASLAAREIDGDDILRALQVPLLVTQGLADTVVLPAMAEHVLATCPTAEA